MPGLILAALAGWLLLACGRIDYDPLRDGSAGTAADGAATSPCSPWQPGFSFTAPERLEALNSAGMDYEPSILPDGLTLYFASDRAGGAGETDVYVATRATADATFTDAPVAVSELCTSVSEYKLTLSQDGLSVILSADWPGGPGGADLWAGARASGSSPFGDFRLLEGINTAADEYDPHLSVDGLRLYYETYDPPWGSAGDGEIVVATRATSTGAFAAPTLIPGFAARPTTIEGNPTLSADELVLVYNSDASGGMEIWYATRASVGEPFGAPALLAEVNSTAAEAQTALRADGCELFFTSNREGGAGGHDLYHARYVPPP